MLTRHINPLLSRWLSAKVPALPSPGVSSTPSTDGVLPHLSKVSGHLAPLGLSWPGGQQTAGKNHLVLKTWDSLNGL